MRKALTTILIGDESQAMWNHRFRWSWEAYAQRHNYNIEIFTEPLPGAEDKVPAWSKPLVAEQPRIGKYDRFVWVDADVAINPSAPDICELMEPRKIGMVTWKGSYREDPVYLDHAFKSSWRNNGLQWWREKNIQSMADIQVACGYLPCDDWFNAGMFVASPTHGPLFREIFDRGLDSPSADQPALVDGLLRANPRMVQPLDKRFNVIWDMEVSSYYPFLRYGASFDTVRECVWACFRRSYFLHFINGQTRNHSLLLHP
jgi:hypothetical protein